MGTYVYLWVKYLKNVLNYKYLGIITYRYLSTSTQVHEQYLSTRHHWCEWITFRLAVLVYRCLQGTAPAYLSANLLRVSEVGSRQRLLSATTSALVGRHTQRSTIGKRAFAAATSAVWNSLPEDVRSSTSLQLFWCRLKSELFQRSLGPRHST